jgi:hypothetical protein
MAAQLQGAEMLQIGGDSLSPFYGYQILPGLPSQVLHETHGFSTASPTGTAFGEAARVDVALVTKTTPDVISTL